MQNMDVFHQIKLYHTWNIHIFYIVLASKSNEI